MIQERDLISFVSIFKGLEHPSKLEKYLEGSQELANKPRSSLPRRQKLR
jgi:hypothetical protein